MGYPRFLLSRRCKVVDRRTGTIAALTSTTWANLDTTADIALEAQVGDLFVVDANGRWGGEAQSAAIDVATWLGGVGVSWFGSGEPTTTSGSGIPSWRANPLTGQDEYISGSMTHTIVAGDISTTGIVTCRLRYRVSGSKTFYNSATDPFQWRVENIGPQDPT